MEINIKARIQTLTDSLPSGVSLVVTSKTHPVESIMEAYDGGHRIFGESRVQELEAKYRALPKDIKWHMIGPLQRNKVKYIAPFVELIHSVDSERLMRMIDREAAKNGRTIDILLQAFVADEDTKQGWEPSELEEFVKSGVYKECKNIRVRGVMGMASFTDNQDQIRGEFTALYDIFTTLRNDYFDTNFDILSMGMTSDYKLAVECGSNMLRIGSLIFGER